ncbi:MAG: hypothetical protein ACI39U_03585 [Candidatus Cryptobacteroides sp.]
MKWLENILVCLLPFAVLLCSCTKELPEEQPMEVTYNSISGVWELTEWNGQELAEDSYFWMSINRSDHKVTIYQKIDSMYGRIITGTCELRKKELVGSIISGVYDYGAGDWSHEYLITGIWPSGTMVWKVLDSDPEDVSVYTRHDEIPSWVLEDCIE